jgi:hypothetical protein
MKRALTEIAGLVHRFKMNFTECWEAFVRIPAENLRCRQSIRAAICRHLAVPYWSIPGHTAALVQAVRSRLLNQQSANPREDFFYKFLRKSLQPLAGPILVVERADLMAKDHSLRLGPGSAQRNREPMLPRKLSALRDRTRQNHPEAVELGN